MPEGEEPLRQRILELCKELDVATTAKHAAGVARALVSWVATERCLEVLAEASSERGAEFTTAEYLAAALADDYLAAERALRVSSEATTQPDVTSAEKVKSKKSPAVRQQQKPLHHPSSSSSDSEGGGAQSWARSGMGGGVQQLVGGGVMG